MLALTLAVLSAVLVSGYSAECQGNCAGQSLTTEPSHGVIQRRSLLSASDELATCFWDGTECVLRRDFVIDLPKLLGSATTESAKVLADAALRALECSNFTGKPECLAAASYSCDWDEPRSRCTLASILNYTMLTDVVFCADSPLDTAFRCVAESGSAASCTSVPYNCTSVEGLLPLDALSSSLRSAAGSLFGSLGDTLGSDRLLSSVMGTLMGAMAKYGMSGMTGTAAAIGNIIKSFVQSVQDVTSVVSASLPPVCAPSWMVDSSYMSKLGQVFSSALQSNTDMLTAFLSSDLAGSCANGTSRPLLSAAAACRNASASTCAALEGCQWVAGSGGGGGSCSVGPGLLPSLVLDPSDRWVQVLKNATKVCRTFLNEASCSSTTNITILIMEGVGNQTITDRWRPLGGDGGGGGAAAAATTSWWLVAAATLVAMALGAAVRRS